MISHNLANVFQVADRIYVLGLAARPGTSTLGETSEEEVVGAITGAEFGGERRPRGEEKT